MTEPDLIVGGLSVRVDWAAIMRRIRWAARMAGLSVPKRVSVAGRSSIGRSCDPVKAAGDCQRALDGYRITICTGAAWLASVEEVLVHEGRPRDRVAVGGLGHRAHASLGRLLRSALRRLPRPPGRAAKTVFRCAGGHSDSALVVRGQDRAPLAASAPIPTPVAAHKTDCAIPALQALNHHDAAPCEHDLDALCPVFDGAIVVIARYTTPGAD